MKPLPSLRGDLLRQKLDNELLVYDAQDEQIHLLNASTTKIVELIDDGASADAIADELGADKGREAGAEMLALALDELAATKLVATPAGSPVMEMMGPTTRRKAMQRIAGLSAALLIPAIVTLAPGKAGAQGGLPSKNRANGIACTTSAQCASGCCGGNAAGTCVNNVCNPKDGRCSNC